MADKSPFILTLPSGEELTVAWHARAGQRSLRLRRGKNGFTVSSHAWIPRLVVQAFLKQHIHWLAAHAQQQPEKSTLLYLGKPYAVEIIPSVRQQHRGVRVLPEGIIELNPIADTTVSAQRQLERWLQSQAAEWCTPLLQSLAQKLGLVVPTVRFRDTSSRWGSCSSTGSIMLSWRLIHAPPEVIRYVIVHELAHRVHMNHSAAFWKYVEAADPDFRLHRGWLKRHGHECGTPSLLTHP